MIENIKELTVVDFYANWCGPCKMLAPIIESVCEENNINLLKINVDESEEAIKHGIMSIPTIFIVKNGTVLEKKIGLISKEEIINMINKHK